MTLVSTTTLPTITQLSAVNSLEKVEALNGLGIYTLRDMAEYAPCRHAAQLLVSFQDGKAEEATLDNYIEADALTAENISRLNELDIAHLIGVRRTDAERLRHAFNVGTLSQLASFPPYVEAQHIVIESIRGEFYEKPSAPTALIPKPIGSTHTQARFSDYVRDREVLLKDYELTYLSDADEPAPRQILIDVFKRARFKCYFGYLASISQKWMNDGPPRLGEIIHSLALAPGESRNVAVLDWFRRQRSSRREDTTADEQLTAEFIQTRALNEVVQTTANEHLEGGTEVDASTKTTGAGLVGGLGGGKSKGASAAVDLGMFGLPVKAGAAALEALAGSIGGSVVYSNGSSQGTLKSETSGERTVAGTLVQNISDATVQNASNVRSVMSTVVVEDEQAGRQRAQTRNVTNYNHSHALTIQYSEVLHSYRVKTGVDSLCPVLFLPFGPVNFSIRIIQDYWYLFRKAVKQALPGRFFEFDQVVKAFSPDNEAFDPSADVRVERVKIIRTRKFSEAIRVKLTDANPQVTLAISGVDMDNCLTFRMSGNSTYIDYRPLKEAVLDQSDFGSTEAFEIEEGIAAFVSSTFRSQLKKAMKQYLGDTKKVVNTGKTKEKNLEDNELGMTSDRDKLKADVDNELFTILNKDEQVDLTLDIDYTVADRNGQSQNVLQSISRSYTYARLNNEISEHVGDVTAHINGQLAVVADINPTDVIEDIEQHFRFHKYGYTKYLLANVEKEQIVDIMEHLGLFSDAETIALTSVIDPSPLGLTENLLIFRMKEDDAARERQLGKVFHGTIESDSFGKGTSAVTGLGVQHSVIRNGDKAWRYQFSGHPAQAATARDSTRIDVVLYLAAKANEAGQHRADGTISRISTIDGIQHTYPLAISGTADRATGTNLKVSFETATHQRDTLEWTLKFPDASAESLSAVVTDYVGGLRRYEADLRRRHRWETVFLPSSGVFAEAILGLSNASEYINLRRFYNWQDSPIPHLAPGIQAVDVNHDHSQPVSDALSPTVPVSVLNQVSPMQYPYPTSLGAALQAVQNGAMFSDMSKTDQFAGILGNLATLANNTAQLSGNLAGDAGANALNAAVELGRQVASMVGTAMNTNVADPPATSTKTGGVLEALDEIARSGNGGGQVSPVGQAQAGALGAPIPELTAADQPGGVAVSTDNSILPGADLTAERRAFSPASLDKSGKTSFSVSTADLPDEYYLRWRIPSSQSGRYWLGANPDPSAPRASRSMQLGDRADVTAVRPGQSTIELEVRDASDALVRPAVSYALSIPQFVEVNVEQSFQNLHAGYGLTTAEIEDILRVAKDVCDQLLVEANVRTIWIASPFNEVLPAQFAAGSATRSFLTTAAFQSQPTSPGFVGNTEPRNFPAAPAQDIGPRFFDERIFIWTAGFDDPSTGGESRQIDDVTWEVISNLIANGFSAGDRSLSLQVLGRLYGETLAHEIGHSLIGWNLSGGNHNKGTAQGDPVPPSALMNAGPDRSFRDRTGFDADLAKLGNGPLADALTDHGVAAINRLAGRALSVAQGNFPVPPLFE